MQTWLIHDKFIEFKRIAQQILNLEGLFLGSKILFLVFRNHSLLRMILNP